MSKINEFLEPFGIQTANILLPNKSIDLKKWSVIACDQYSSEPNYWNEVKEIVKEDYSTNNLVFPECYLDKGNDEAIIGNINTKMQEYIQSDVFTTLEDSFILVKRTLRSGKVRWGLMAALDLENYDFSVGSKSLIRATEGTIIERIPPRLKIRKDAAIELPHIMVLVDDAKAPLISPLIEASKKIKPIYETDLMQDSGNLIGFPINNKKLLKNFAKSLSKLASVTDFSAKYGSNDLLLFAIGDGNHSLATAKTQWEEIKKTACPCSLHDHPARYALIELNSIYDNGIEFEPIHRVIFNADSNKFVSALEAKYNIEVTPVLSDNDIEKFALSLTTDQKFVIITAEGKKWITIKNPDKNLTVGTLQPFLDSWITENKSAEIDYIHGVDSTTTLGSKTGNFGIILPNISKEEFFATVIADGSFPRKTFSMGEAHEKRFYFEARKIK